MATKILGNVILGLIALLIALLCAVVVKAAFFPSPRERNDLFTRWNDDRLQIAGSDGRWLVTHLENLTNQSIAKLPEPLFVVESGGISLTLSNLAQLTWNVPAGPFDNPFTLKTAASPSPNIPIQALYIPVSRAKYVQ